MVSKFENQLTDWLCSTNWIFPSETVFKLGDGRKVKSKENVIFPVVIADKKCKIKEEIVKRNISLLLSKSSLKKAQTVIDLDNDKATILGKEINLHQSTTSDYCIDISPSNSCNNIEEILYLEKDLSNDQRKASFDLHTLLHRQ